MPRADQVGVVAIGRNEGERLRTCLTSALASTAHVVYVDSGSTDGSSELARGCGVHVVELDAASPFTAARGRNAGLERLRALAPHVELVQFVDGDCELVEGWIDRATRELAQGTNVAVVCGRRRERFPERSIFNRLCDVEWDTPSGETTACGGDALMRVDALVDVGAFRADMIAGEEPELCARLRQQGLTIVRIDVEMTVHDAQMTRFSQWWKRMTRAGHAYMEGRWLHGQPPSRLGVRETNRCLFWALALPSIGLGGAWATDGATAWLLLLYPLQFLRIAWRARRSLPTRDAAAYAASCVLGWFAQLTGALRFLAGRVFKTRSRLIEYKSAR